jgi:hypothetical protein
MEEKTEYYTTTTTSVPTTTTTTTTTTHYTTTAKDYDEEEKTIVLDNEHHHSSETHLEDTIEEYDSHGNHINFVMSDAEKRLIRKMDYIYVMPFVCILNFLQVNYDDTL